jgi:hypothetical protein
MKNSGQRVPPPRLIILAEFQHLFWLIAGFRPDLFNGEASIATIYPADGYFSFTSIRKDRTSASGGPPLAVTGNSWAGPLQAGDYVVDASAAVPDNRVGYDLTVRTAELIPGQNLDVQAPTTIPVSLGGSPQYEISSFGGQDVRASLYDSNGHLVAANDDRDNDWNFLISGAFPPGAYTLRVDPVGPTTRRRMCRLPHQRR